MKRELKIPFQWETLDEFKSKDGRFQEHTKRTKVFGGWLIKDLIYIHHDDGSKYHKTQLKFIKDPEHQWRVR